MKLPDKVKSFKDYFESIDDIFNKEEDLEAKETEDIEKSEKKEEEEEEEEEEDELEEEEEEKVWGDESMVERIQTFESFRIDKEYALKDIKYYNEKNEDLKDTVISIIKNLGFKDSPSNVDEVMNHISASMSGDLIPEDGQLIDEILDILNKNT